MIFEPFTIKNVTFKNRLVRSSIGGRTAYYDGTVSNAWKNFELRFEDRFDYSTELLWANAKKYQDTILAAALAYF